MKWIIKKHHNGTEEVVTKQELACVVAGTAYHMKDDESLPASVSPDMEQTVCNAVNRANPGLAGVAAREVQG
jgi:hypothetical protein